jgi:DNA-binding MarR family transcriptional regulator
MEITGIDNKYMIYGMLFSITNRIQTLGDQEIKDITMKQHFMMVVLQMLGNKEPTLSELADALGCSYQNIKRMAASLEMSNYVIITGDDKDKRKRHIIMTDKFTKMGELYMEMTKKFMEGLYSGINEDELRCVAGVLNKMDVNMKKLKMESERI